MIGPVQLLVLGFSEPDFKGEVIAELDRLSVSDTVKVIDSLVVYKDAEGGLTTEHLSNLAPEEALEVGATIGALIGLGMDGEEGMEAGAISGAEAIAEGASFINEDRWDVLKEIPENSAAALILLEHRWAIPLRSAVTSAGGFRINDAFISPLDLVGLGLLSSAEAEDLRDVDFLGSKTG